jgi:hypothetical protein
MTMRKPKRKPPDSEPQGEPGKRGHKLLRKHQTYTGPRHARPFERHRHSRFK